MIQKYKKAGLAALACTLLGMNAAEAAVILTFAQDGPNVTAAWSGAYDVPASTLSGTSLAQGASFYHAFDGRGSGDIIFVGGVGSESTARIIEEGVFVQTAFPTRFRFNGSYTGSTFGFSRPNEPFLPSPDGASLILASGTTPGQFSPVGTMTFASTTLAAMGAANYDSTLAYTGNGSVGGSREIRFNTAAVPEPTSALLLGLGGLGLVARRRRA